jgi:transposase
VGEGETLSAAQAKVLLAAVRPRDAAGQARRRVAAELISDLGRIYQRKKAADRELRDLLKATGTTLTSLNGIGPSGAARLLIEAGDITRFPSKAHFASWNGTAPIDASSGDQVRHRLSRAGNRQINRALHIMAVVQLRHRGSEGRAYYDRKVAAGKTPREAMRSLKRRLSDIAYHQMVLDARAKAAAPGGHVGRLLAPARPACTPAPALRRSHFPDPPPTTLRQEKQPILLAAPGTPPRRRTADGVKRNLLDGGEDRGTLSRPGMPP